MLSAIKNFFLTFVISLVIFGLIAYMVVGLVVENINGSFGGGVTTPEATTGIEPVVTNAQGDIIGIQYGDGGESFNVLLVGTDYRPSTFVDYNPEQLKNLYGIAPKEFTPVQTPSDLALPKSTSGILSDIRVEADDGVRTTDGYLAFKNGFYSVEYRVIEADTIVLLRIDKERGQYSYTVFPADAYVPVSGKYMKLSEVYGVYGVDFLMDKVHALTGIVIDHYAVLSMEEFPAVIDALGGVNYYVPCNMNYDDYAGDIHIHLTAGRQNLNGEKALQLLMFNSYEDSTMSRKATTISFLKTIVSSLTNITNYSAASLIFDRVDDLITTDFTASDFVNNIDMIFKYATNSVEISAITKTEKVGADNLEVIDEKATITAFTQYRRIYN